MEKKLTKICEKLVVYVSGQVYDVAFFDVWQLPGVFVIVGISESFDLLQKYFYVNQVSKFGVSLASGI